MNYSNLQLELFSDYMDMKIESIPYFDEPVNDNQRLLNCQYRYLVLHEQSAYEQLWESSLKIVRRFIRKEREEKGFSLASDEVMDKALDAVEYVLRRYKKTPGYYIKDSFTSELYFGVIHALYHQTQSQQILDKAIKYMNENNCINLEEALESVKIGIQRKKLMEERKHSQGVLFET